MKGWVGLVGGRLTHINGYPSAAGPVQTSERSPIKDRRSTTEPPDQHWATSLCVADSLSRTAITENLQENK